MAPRLKLPTQLGWRFGLLLLLLAALSLLIGTRAAIDVNQNTKCLADYAARNAEVSAIRSAATAEKDAAVARLLDPLVSVILDVTPPSPRPADPADVTKLRKAARDYMREQNELAAKRAANPLPSFPVRCSELNP